MGSEISVSLQGLKWLGLTLEQWKLVIVKP